MPPAMRRALIFVGLLSLAFLVISWGVVGYSLRAPSISGLPDHRPAASAHQCLACHAAAMPHPAFPTCGFCHR